MDSIVVFVIWLVTLPFVLFGELLEALREEIARVFQPQLLLAGVWTGGLGGWLLASSAPDDSRPFLTLVDVVAQSHIGLVSTPVALLALAGVLVVAAGVVALRDRRLPA